MEIQIAVAKVNKYAVSESGDTLEVIERPTGGLSVVLADGQTSGRGAKAVSMLVVRKVIGSPGCFGCFVRRQSWESHMHLEYCLG